MDLSLDIKGQDEEYRYVMGTFHELDTCLKIMEVSTALFDRERAELVIVRELQKSFSGATGLANNKYAEWRATYGG
jgi:hypothetical protein